jgi:hypothetical protein
MAGVVHLQRHHVIGVAAPAHLDRQTEVAVLMDHVEEVESATTRGEIELEVYSPDL